MRTQLGGAPVDSAHELPFELGPRRVAKCVTRHVEHEDVGLPLKPGTRLAEALARRFQTVRGHQLGCPHHQVHQVPHQVRLRAVPFCCGRRRRQRDKQRRHDERTNRRHDPLPGRVATDDRALSGRPKAEL